MNIGNSVRKAIDDWSAGEYEAAILHACNAVDGTAKRAYPGISGSNARFTKLLRDNYNILGILGMPGIDLINTRFPVNVERPKASGGKPDLADVIYGVHRCTHGHGEELPGGFELIPNAGGSANITEIEVVRGAIRLSDRIIFGLLGVAVFSPANVGQRVPDSYYLTLGESDKFIINEWWGRAADFAAVAAKYSLPCVTLDFGDWMT